ncbi:hypothetical protein [Actinospica sp.]|jgi:hypothetical protein|uniref:hypothetical protein n=1 Tax=Actinospica sp. TaxID=1872142 RepID=UPI002C657675|nr:hypothetical protein [Actinospica sp.]HWG24427.1 hypothetical protein [Actinospica sp.]
MNLRRTQFLGLAASGLVLVLAGCGASTAGSGTADSTPKKAVAVAKSSASPVVSTTSPSTAPTSAAPPPAPVTSQSSTPSPASVVDAYFAAINAENYKEAWSLGGDNLGQSYDQFVAGFSGTATDSVDILSSSGDTVSVDLTATNTDGSQQQFTGTYTVSGQAISRAAITQIGAAPTSLLCGAPANPYGYNLCGIGSDVTSPPSDICSYFSCIDNFGNGNGYMVECNDGMYSMSGGIEGVCSDHGGEGKPVSSG